MTRVLLGALGRLLGAMLLAGPGALTAGCSPSPAAPDLGGDGGTGAAPACEDVPRTFGGARPTALHVPPGLDCAHAAPVPLVIMLHGYSASGDLEEAYLQLTAEADRRGFLYAHPDGLRDAAGNRFWNATDACCNLGGVAVDDSAYVAGLIDEIAAAWPVDAKRVFLVGHSNGGFMSYRMACEHADRIAAMASLAGAMWQDTARCAPTAPVSVLQIHGTLDTVIAYGGGAIRDVPYPSAATTVADWVTLDGCSAGGAMGAPLDLDSALPGSKTTVLKHAGCRAGSAVALWTITGGAHIPTLSAGFRGAVIDWLYAHARP